MQPGVTKSWYDLNVTPERTRCIPNLSKTLTLRLMVILYPANPEKEEVKIRYQLVYRYFPTNLVVLCFPTNLMWVEFVTFSFFLAMWGVLMI